MVMLIVIVVLVFATVIMVRLRGWLWLPLPQGLPDVVAVGRHSQEYVHVVFVFGRQRRWCPLPKL